MIRRIGCFLAFLLLALPAVVPAAARAGPTLVRLQTSWGPITIALETKRAPITTTNFLHYVDEKRFDGTFFYRAARSKYYADRGLVQGGIDTKLVRARLPIAHEPTSKTGLRNGDGTVAMARNDPGTATGNFFITLGQASSLDAKPGYPGYAVFGRVVGGMEIVRRILAAPTFPGGYTETMKGQTIRQPIAIITARRVR